MRKFVCWNPTCGRRIFTERLPALVVPYIRKTYRLVAAQWAIGMVRVGQAVAWLTHRTVPSASLKLTVFPAFVSRCAPVSP
jgi:hypothetical protein